MKTVSQPESTARNQWGWWGIAFTLIGISHWWTFVYMWEYRWFHTDGLYNHAPLVILFGLYLLWNLRPDLAARPCSSAILGLPLLIGGLLMHLAAIFLFRDSISGFSLLLILPGLALLLAGTARTKLLAPVIFLLFFVLPLPDQLLKMVTFPMKMGCTEAGEWFAGLFISSGMELVGNQFRFAGQSGVLVVGEACSGMRSAIALLTIAYCQAFFFGPAGLRRYLLLGLALPVAFLANSLRIGILVLAGSMTSVELASGVFHDIMGYVLYLLALGMLIGLDLIIRRVLPPAAEEVD